MLRRIYIHEHPDWPNFSWREAEIIDLLANVRHLQGMLLGRMEAVGFDLRLEAELEAFTDSVIKTSEIEGEILNPQSVRSSVASRLGVDIGGVAPRDRNVEGIVDITMDATMHCDEPLTQARLFGWHASLFPTGWNGSRPVTPGAWRRIEHGAMQVVSSRGGREIIHFEAPDATKVDQEMQSFITWFNSHSNADGVIKSAIAHLWFITIHPFDDGNGRIARAISDLALARSDGVQQRFYSMSSQIRQERSDYHEILERTQKGTTDITPWMHWFISCLGRALESARDTLASTIAKTEYWDSIAEVQLNQRQIKVLKRLVNGFEGKMTTTKWARMTRASQDTALRDITDLIEKGILERSTSGGRSTSYSLINSAA